jgi:exopolysaccharide biosynthesis polyprenyl glycosylphosphotransferase
MTTADEIHFAAPVSAQHSFVEVPRTIITPRVAQAVENRQRWQRRYRRRLRLTDSLVILGSVALAGWVQISGIAGGSIDDVAEDPWMYLRASLVTYLLWVLALVVFHTRDPKVTGSGSAEYRRVIHATSSAFGLLAIGFIVLQSQGIRTELLVALPMGLVTLVFGRWLCRRWLMHQREVGQFVARALVVGSRRDVAYVVGAIRGSGLSGYQVVGVTLVDDDATSIELDGRTIRAYGTSDTVAQIAASLGADAVILASMHADDPEYPKRLAWELEGTAAELVLSSPLADVAGPRMSLVPIEGLPLIQVTIPTFEGGRYALKRAMDIVIACLALTVIGLITPIIALAIKADSPGPVFFRQERVGRDGRTFRMVKFRSMGVDAEAQKSALQAQNEGAGPLFKMKADPRVTRVGAFLRKYSLDELPQFWNVLVGDMSAVGPRPPLPSEVAEYHGRVYRRLYINPGITGLWQVSGRSDLSWEESVRLDLRYVENWSVMTDLMIMWRTAAIMMKPDGAY